ncbi:MAG TPA: ABC transporter permease subunit [Candidatus Hydrogenedentes bacterium]|nr:ABC transporter permease subunit [Candidatus Hydrogenedentota bacterium]
MTRIRVISANTLRESIRDKALYVLAGFALVAILGSKALGWISVGQDIKIVKDICLAAMSVFGALTAIFVGTNLLYKEIDKKTLYTILAQPMERYEFVVGKYFGLAVLLLLDILFMAAVTALWILILGGQVDLVFFQAVSLIYVKLLLITAFSVLLSALASPILGAVIVFCVYVFGHATEIFRDLPPQITGTPAEPILKAIYYVVPNLSLLDLHAHAANQVPVNGAYVLWAAVYGLGWTAALLALACAAFEGKEL